MRAIISASLHLYTYLDFAIATYCNHAYSDILICASSLLFAQQAYKQFTLFHVKHYEVSARLCGKY